MEMFAQIGNRRPVSHQCVSCGVLSGGSSWCRLCCSLWSHNDGSFAFSVSQVSRQGEDALHPNELLLMGCFPWETQRKRERKKLLVFWYDQERAMVSCKSDLPSWCWNLSASSTVIWRLLLSNAMTNIYQPGSWKTPPIYSSAPCLCFVLSPLWHLLISFTIQPSNDNAKLKNKLLKLWNSRYIFAILLPVTYPSSMDQKEIKF